MIFCRDTSGFWLLHLNGCLARKEAVETSDDILEIGRVSSFNFRCHVALVSDLSQGFTNLRPVDIPFTDVLPIKLAFFPVHLEVFQMHFDDAFIERPDPVLRIAIEYDVS